MNADELAAMLVTAAFFGLGVGLAVGYVVVGVARLAHRKGRGVT